MEERPEFFTTISSGTERRYLFRGVVWAGLGIFWLVYSGSQWPEEVLRVWGGPLFLFSLGLIAYGLLPYRKLLRVAAHPRSFRLEKENLLYLEQGSLLCMIPLESTRQVIFLTVDNLEGLGFYFHEAEPSFLTSRFLRLSRKKYGCDGFFPFFSKRTWRELSALWEQSEA